MAQGILLRGAKQLLTLRGPSGVRRGAALRDLGIIEDGSVLIRDGIIAAVGSTRRVENLKEARGALEIPASGRVVMPGFLDAGLSLTLQNSHDPEKHRRIGDFYDDTLTLMRACLQHGTLGAEVKASAEARDFHSDISVLRKLAHIGSNPVRMVRTWRVDRPVESAETTEDFRRTLGVLARRKLIHFMEFGAEAEPLIDDQVLSAAEAGGIGIKLLWPGGSPEVLLDLLDRFRPVTVCSLSHLAPADAAVIAETSSIAVFATGKDIFEGFRELTARQFLDLGGALALSSGYESASAASFSMQMSLSLAVIRLGLTPEEAFSAATINAAHAAGCGDVTGSLEFGKHADLVVLNVPDYRELPQLYGINHVDMAIRQGNIVFTRNRWRPAAAGSRL